MSRKDDERIGSVDARARNRSEYSARLDAGLEHAVRVLQRVGLIGALPEMSERARTLERQRQRLSDPARECPGRAEHLASPLFRPFDAVSCVAGPQLVASITRERDRDQARARPARHSRWAPRTNHHTVRRSATPVWGAAQQRRA